MGEKEATKSLFPSKKLKVIGVTEYADVDIYLVTRRTDFRYWNISTSLVRGLLIKQVLEKDIARAQVIQRPSS